MDCCLVNTSSSPKGFMACDMLGEYIVREHKSTIPSINTPATFRHHRNVISRQIMKLRESRINMSRLSRATEHYQHSSKVNKWQEVRVMADRLLASQVFERTPGRICNLEGHPYTPAT